MAGGLYSRLFTRPTGGTISGPNDDSEWDNIISNALPAKFDDYSATTGQMDSTKDPYPGDVQALAISLAEEIEHIRWVLAQITGEADWYIDPDVSLASVFTNYVTLTGTETLTNKTLTSPVVDGTGLAVDNAAGATILNEAATATNPTVCPNRVDLGIGLGWAANILKFVVGSVSIAEVSTTGFTINSGTEITKHLSATAVLDFGSIATDNFEDLTITVTGAAVGDTVNLGVPNGSMTDDLFFFGWVSATNTVTVRALNNSGVSARDPASGTYRADVWQH